jgi:hypothetical protein
MLQFNPSPDHSTPAGARAPLCQVRSVEIERAAGGRERPQVDVVIGQTWQQLTAVAPDHYLAVSSGQPWGQLGRGDLRSPVMPNTCARSTLSDGPLNGVMCGAVRALWSNRHCGRKIHAFGRQDCQQPVSEIVTSSEVGSLGRGRSSAWTGRPTLGSMRRACACRRPADLSSTGHGLR